MNSSDPIGRPREKAALFARLYRRVFRKKDTISLLRALLEFSSLKKTLIVYDKSDEYEFVMPKLECTPSKEQVFRKCVALKNFYRSKLSEGSAGLLTGDAAVIFELSEKLWGDEIKQQLKEKKRERSGRAVRVRELHARLGLEDVRPLKNGLEEGGSDVCAKSKGKSSGMVFGKGGKRKKGEEPGKIDRMTENVSGDEVLVDGGADILGMNKSSAKSGSEDGESARRVSPKKVKQQKGVEKSILAKAEDLKAKSGPVDESSASYGLSKKKGHKGRELDDFSGKEFGIKDHGSARCSADSQLDKGEKSRKKKRHKGHEAGDFQRLSDAGKMSRNCLEREDKHKGDKISLELGNLS